MGRLKFTHPQDRITARASWTLDSGSIAVNSALANIYDADPGEAAVFTSAGFRLVGQFDAPQLLAVVCLAHVAGDAALDARFQANTTDDWGAPPLDRALTLSAPDEDGFWPNPLADLTDLDAGDRTYEYVSLYFPDGTILPRLGELLLYDTFRLLPSGDDVAWGYHDPDRFGVTRIETNHRRQMKYLQAPRWFEFSGSVKAHDATLVALRSWRRAARAQNFLIQPDDDVAVGRYVEFMNDDIDPAHEITDAQDVPLHFREVHPGLPWINPDA